jgi:hypothetical protein
MRQDYLLDDERGHFRKWENMFQSEGWELMIKEIQTELEDIPERAFTSSKNFDELVAFRVRARVLAELLAYPAIIEQRKEQLQTSRKMEQADAEDSIANHLL